MLKLAMVSSMRIDIQSRNFELPSARIADCRRRVWLEMGRLAPRVRSVRATFTDVNGPRGGVAIACRMEVRGHDGWTVHIEDVDVEPGRAFAFALARAGRAVARQVRRARERHAGGHHAGGSTLDGLQ
jgi:hypothetical protein